MRNIQYDDQFLSEFLSSGEIEGYAPAVAQAERLLMSKSGPGNDFLGWLDLPKKAGKRH